MDRASGILMHISSLYGEYSCGSFGKEAKEFVDFVASMGFSYWQILPFGMVDECNSPYKSYSAFAGNPFFIDLNLLGEKGLLTKGELESQRQNTPYSCEFDRLRKERYEILLKASKRVSVREEVERFIENNPQLEKFVEFMALKKANDDRPWNEWTNFDTDTDILFMWKFIQFEFFSQWEALRSYANSKGVKIIGDIPIYVSYDSSDVWANKEEFLLDENDLPGVVAGVPPDYFCEEGQMWGNPLYNWNAMEENGFSWWSERLSHMLKYFDGLRIDHFRGLESYYSIPAEDENAKNGKWEKGPGKAFIDKINEISKDKLVIAEDLGEITREVTELVTYSGFPGMRVLQFGFLDDEDNLHKPHNYNNNTVAYTGTHDNNTLLGYVWELSEEQRNTLLKYSGYDNPNWDACYDSIIRTMFASHAGLLILPIQDILGYGSDTRLNVPGTAEGNWQYRVTKEQLDSVSREKYKNLNYLYKRGK